MDEGFYPVKENLIEGFDKSSPEAVLLVDIGGSLGHDCEEFLRKFPDAPGRIVLQDLPVVVEQITDLDEKVERMGYDFYDKQPIKGAHSLPQAGNSYCLHTDVHCKQAPGYITCTPSCTTGQRSPAVKLFRGLRKP